MAHLVIEFHESHTVHTDRRRLFGETIHDSRKRPGVTKILGFSTSVGSEGGGKGWTIHRRRFGGRVPNCTQSVKCAGTTGTPELRESPAPRQASRDWPTDRHGDPRAEDL